jgi:hypothetical protein
MKNLARRVAHKHLEASTTRKANYDVMEFILPQREVIKCMDQLEDAGDEQSSKLLYEAYRHLAEKFELSSSEQDALGRIKAVVKNTNWDHALKRNNIGKAVNSLGLSTRGYFFASDTSKQAGPRPLHLDGYANLNAKVKERLAEVQDEANRMLNKYEVIVRAWQRQDLGLLTLAGVFTRDEANAIRQAQIAHNEGDEVARDNFLSRIASRSPYEVLQLDNYRNIYAKVREAKNDLLEEQNRLGRQHSRIQYAWDSKDIDALVEYGVLSDYNKVLIDGALHAYNEGQDAKQIGEILKSIR